MARPERPEASSSALLRELRRLGPVDMAFSATVDAAGSTFVLDRFEGARTRRLHGVVSPVGVGLGGRSIAMGRPAYVTDYVSARGISHQYDAPVSDEGLRSIIAVPVTEDGVVRRVVYAGSRRSCGFGDRFVDRAVVFVHERTSGRRAAGADLDPTTPSLDGPQVREVHAELRAIIASTNEPAVRRRLSALLTRLSGPAAARPAAVLTPRELDVLSLVALGCANSEAADRLGLTLQTTKSYLKSAMSKLDSHTRGEAVHAARRAGLLP